MQLLWHISRCSEFPIEKRGQCDASHKGLNTMWNPIQLRLLMQSILQAVNLEAMRLCICVLAPNVDCSYGARCNLYSLITLCFICVLIRTNVILINLSHGSLTSAINRVEWFVAVNAIIKKYIESSLLFLRSFLN